ncbi:MAG: A/G-specific adenine glycosylase, partial [Actinomycetota bacterium]
MRSWYRPRRSAYPWRGSRDPYAVLVSEVMLQQTQAARVAPAFERFVSTFPGVRSLAVASRADVLRAWDGLGYNRRAVALSEAARTIERDHGGRVPSDPRVLRSLPGVGPYTADAVASLAFGAPVPALDTNVRRVVARVRLGVEAHQVTGGRLRSEAEDWLDRDDPGGWN